VLVSSKRLTALHELCQDWETSPFLHGFALRYLSHLMPEAATGLVYQRQAARSVQAAPGLVAQIRQLTGGHPYLLQLLCSRLFSDGSLRPIADEDLAFVEAQMTGFVLNDFAALSGPERAILRAVSSGQPFPADAHPTYLHGLVGLGILRHEGDGYAIGNAFFARWLREQADWEAKAEVSAEGTLAVYSQAEMEQIRLRRILTAGFDMSELRVLCFDVGIDHEDLPSETKMDMARELVAYCVRHGRISKLVETGRRLRPDIRWEDMAE
jgi:hypothetical protein